MTFHRISKYSRKFRIALHFPELLPTFSGNENFRDTKKGKRVIMRFTYRTACSLQPTCPPSPSCAYPGSASPRSSSTLGRPLNFGIESLVEGMVVSCSARSCEELHRRETDDQSMIKTPWLHELFFHRKTCSPWKKRLKKRSLVQANFSECLTLILNLTNTRILRSLNSF